MGRKNVEKEIKRRKFSDSGEHRQHHFHSLQTRKPLNVAELIVFARQRQRCDHKKAGQATLTLTTSYFYRIPSTPLAVLLIYCFGLLNCFKTVRVQKSTLKLNYCHRTTGTSIDRPPYPTMPANGLVFTVSSILLVLLCTSPFCSIDRVQAATFNDLAVRNFQCDADLNEITDPLPLSLKGRNSIRICIERNADIQADVYILKFNEYRFQKDVTNPDGSSVRLKQTAIEAGVAVNPFDVSNDNNGNGDGSNNSIETTKINCTPGATICSFTTRINDDFLKTEGLIRGFGSVAVQFGNRRSLQSILFRGSSNNNQQREEERNLQGFAGIVELTLNIETTLDEVTYDENDPEFDVYIAGDDDSGNGFQKYWISLPTYAKALYIVGIVMVFLCLFCCLVVWCLWDSHFHRMFDKDTVEEEVYDDDTDADESVARKAILAQEAALVSLPGSSQRLDLARSSSKKQVSTSKLTSNEVLLIDQLSNSPKKLVRASSTKSARMLASPGNSPRKTPRRAIQSEKSTRRRLDRSAFGSLPALSLTDSRHSESPRTPKRAASMVASNAKCMKSPNLLAPPLESDGESASVETPKRTASRKLLKAQSSKSGRSLGPGDSPRTPKRLGSKKLSKTNSPESDRSMEQLEAPPTPDPRPDKVLLRASSVKSPRSLIPPDSPTTPRRGGKKMLRATSVTSAGAGQGFSDPTDSPRTPRNGSKKRLSAPSTKSPRSLMPSEPPNPTTPRRKAKEIVPSGPSVYAAPSTSLRDPRSYELSATEHSSISALTSPTYVSKA